jgi:MYXO-CTERM domain-containing protein
MALAAAVSSAASATFVQYVVVKTSTTNSGQALDVYNVFARFNGATDTLLNAFNFNRVDGSATNMFYHKDNSDYNGGVLSNLYGTWAPQLTGSATLNRPFDSFLVIGGQATPTNTTNADPSWVSGGTGAGAGDSRSWNRADLPNNGTLGWFNSNPPNNQGRVGGAGNTATDVRLGQFVLSANDAALRNYTLTLGYNNGVAGSAVQFATGTFSLPTPGAIALLGLAGLAGRRRR